MGKTRERVTIFASINNTRSLTPSSSRKIFRLDGDIQKQASSNRNNATRRPCLEHAVLSREQSTNEHRSLFRLDGGLPTVKTGKEACSFGQLSQPNESNARKSLSSISANATPTNSEIDSRQFSSPSPPFFRAESNRWKSYR